MSPEIFQTVEWSRAQFALTAIYHWLFVPLTLGLGFLIALMETRYYRTGDLFWLRTTKFWMRLFGINFAIGVATGLILEFEFGTNWSNYSHFVGDIFGAPLAIEGLMAFFLEATFIAVMFFGWNKVSKRFHLAATWLTVGCRFNVETVRNEMTSFGEVLFSPVAINKFFHTVTSSFLLAALFVVGVSAWYLLRGRDRETARRSIGMAAPFGLLFALLAATTGDRSGAEVARVQPMKLAAMEALYDGEAGAPLTVFALLRPEAERTSNETSRRLRIEIPKLLSLMSYRDVEAYVAGINDLIRGNPEQGILSAEEKIARGREAIGALARYRTAREAGDRQGMAAVERLFDPATPEGAEFLSEKFAWFGYGYIDDPARLVPNVPLLFYSFRIMVGAGLFFILLLGVVWRLNSKERLADKRWLLRLCILAVPLAYIASQAGWVVAEAGRQPWAIQNLLPVGVAVTKIGASSVAVTFFLFLALFTALLAAEVSIRCRQIKIGPEKE